FRWLERERRRWNARQNHLRRQTGRLGLAIPRGKSFKLQIPSSIEAPNSKLHRSSKFQAPWKLQLPSCVEAPTPKLRGSSNSQVAWKLQLSSSIETSNPKVHRSCKFQA